MIPGKPVVNSFTNVVDNSWTGTTWSTPKKGYFTIKLVKTSGQIGCWGRSNRCHLQMQVKGVWKDVPGYAAGGTAYKAPKTEEFDSGSTMITGIRMQTPTWKTTTSGCTITIEILWLNQNSGCVPAVSTIQDMGYNDPYRGCCPPSPSPPAL